jgi:IPT/TIG domain
MSDPTPIPGESPGGKPMGAWGIALVTVYLVFVTIVVFHSLVVLWPPNRDNENKDVTDRLGRIEKALGIEETPAAVQTPAVQATPGSLTTDLLGSDLTSDLVRSDFTTSTGTPPLGTDMTEGEDDADEESYALAWKECGPGGQLSTKIFWLDFCLSDEERLFLIVMFAGALGGLVHAVRSFYWYAGCRKLVLSWTGFYITLPVLGASMATIFYLVVRGGFFSPQSEISDTSPFGFAALAVLVGMFTEQAAMKLKDILETFLAQAPKGTDQAGTETMALTVSTVTPAQGPQTGATVVTVSGKSFAQGAVVTFGGQPATAVSVAADGTSLTATTPAATAAGAVTVEVTNPDGKKGSQASGFTYV